MTCPPSLSPASTRQSSLGTCRYSELQPRSSPLYLGYVIERQPAACASAVRYIDRHLPSAQQPPQPSTCIALNRHEHPADLYRTYPLLLSPASNSATCNNSASTSWWITRTSEAPFTDASLVVFLRLQLTPADPRTPADVHLFTMFLQPRFVSTSANDIQRSTLLRRQQPDVAICKQPVHDSSVE